MLEILKLKVKKYAALPKVLYKDVKSMDSRQEVYETCMVMLVLAVIVLSLIDTFATTSIGFTKYVEVFDLFVCAIFAVDLTVRYRKTEKKKEFFKSSWLEMIAIIPFDVVFRVFRIVRIVRLARLGRFSKLIRSLNTICKLEKLPLLTKAASPSYVRYKRFNKLLLGYGKRKCEENEKKQLGEATEKSPKN